MIHWHTRLLWTSSAVLLLVLLLTGRAGFDDWKFDVLWLKNGKSFKDLLLQESAEEIRFRCVRRSPGSPTVVISTTFHRHEVQRIDQLDSKDRAQLESRLKALDPTGKDEAQRMENLDLMVVHWLRAGEDALCYPSDHFVLVSNAREDIVRRAAVRLEQIYAAYGRFLPPRHHSGKASTIYLVRSLAEYHDLLRERNHTILHSAFYDAGRNQILCASDLQRLGDELEKVRKEHQEILRKWKEIETDLLKYHKGKIPAARRQQIDAKRLEVYNANLKNDGIFKDATQQLFRTLYHEAFHAYLANFVYPIEEGRVPRWLNEGLAQIFETALVEAGELRVGHADRDRLNRLKASARKGESVPLSDLLRAGPQKFLVAHAGEQQVSDRYYLHSWALAFYLTFERHLLATPALDRYVRALKRGADPLEAFERLTGQPTARFEQDFHQYLLKLRPDGSTGK